MSFVTIVFVGLIAIVMDDKIPIPANQPNWHTEMSMSTATAYLVEENHHQPELWINKNDVVDPGTPGSCLDNTRGCVQLTMSAPIYVYCHEPSAYYVWCLKGTDVETNSFPLPLEYETGSRKSGLPARYFYHSVPVPGQETDVTWIPEMNKVIDRNAVAVDTTGPITSVVRKLRGRMRSEHVASDMWGWCEWNDGSGTCSMPPPPPAKVNYDQAIAEGVEMTFMITPATLRLRPVSGGAPRQIALRESLSKPVEAYVFNLPRDPQYPANTQTTMGEEDVCVSKHFREFYRILDNPPAGISRVPFVKGSCKRIRPLMSPTDSFCPPVIFNGGK